MKATLFYTWDGTYLRLQRALSGQRVRVEAKTRFDVATRKFYQTWNP